MVSALLVGLVNLANTIPAKQAWIMQYYSAVQYSAVQLSTVKYSKVQYSTVQYCTVQYYLYNNPHYTLD